MDLRTVNEQLLKTDVCDWNLPGIESLLVSNVPRWGLLLSKGNLVPLMETLHTVISRGLAIRSMPGSPFPAIASVKLELLRMLWYSSTLSTLEQILRVNVVPGVESEDSMFSNVVLGHYPGSVDEVTRSQAAALKSLFELLRLVHIEGSSGSVDLNPLKASLRELLLKDSASLLVGICYFVFGSGVAESVSHTAAGCLRESLRVCEIPPSTFLNNPKVKKLNELVLTAIISNPTVVNLSLLSTIIEKCPSLISTNDLQKQTISAIQKEPALAGSAEYLFAPDSALLSTADAPSLLTGGMAVSLVRSGSESSVNEFLKSTLGSPEWIESNLLASPEQTSLLTSFFSVLQDARVEFNGISSGSVVHEPSLSHVVCLARLGSVDPEAVKLVNAELKKYKQKQALGECLDGLVAHAIGQGWVSTFSMVEGSILAVLGDLVAKDRLTQIVREYPLMMEKLMKMLGAIIDAKIATKGVPLNTNTPDIVDGSDVSHHTTMKIVAQLISSVISFGKLMSHRGLFFACLRLLPHWLSGSRSHPKNGLRLDRLLRDLLMMLDPDLVFADPVVLASVDAILVRLVEFDSMLPPESGQLLGDLVAWFGAVREVADLRCVVSLLSVIATLVAEIDNEKKSYPVWVMLASHPIIYSASDDSAWDLRTRQYTLSHLVWMHALNVAVVLALSGHTAGSSCFVHAYKTLFSERFTTAHTGDLGTLEETCLMARLVELLSDSSVPQPSFQFTSLVTPKPSSVYPRSEREKISAQLAPYEDIQAPCVVPSVFAQRTVWLAADILANRLRIGLRSQTETSDFHALLDCGFFIGQYLKEVHRMRCVYTICMMEGGTVYVPLSVFLGTPSDEEETKIEPKKETTNTTSSLLASFQASSPQAKPTKNPAGSLMDSLTPKGSPKKPDDSGKSMAFFPPRKSDCPTRTGLSFVAPAVITIDDYTGKLVDLLSLCLILASKIAANSDALLRPLLDLLLSMQSTENELPQDAVLFVKDLVAKLTPIFNNSSKTNNFAIKK